MKTEADERPPHTTSGRTTRVAADKQHGKKRRQTTKTHLHTNRMRDRQRKAQQNEEDGGRKRWMGGICRFVWVFQFAGVCFRFPSLASFRLLFVFFALQWRVFCWIDGCVRICGGACVVGVLFFLSFLCCCCVVLRVTHMSRSAAADHQHEHRRRRRCSRRDGTAMAPLLLLLLWLLSCCCCCCCRCRCRCRRCCCCCCCC